MIGGKHKRKYSRTITVIPKMDDQGGTERRLKNTRLGERRKVNGLNSQCATYGKQRGRNQYLGNIGANHTGKRYSVPGSLTRTLYECKMTVRR